MAYTSPASATGTDLQGYPEFVEVTMQEWKVPGVAVAIVKDDEIVFAQGFGKRDLAENLEVTPQTVFAIASCSKAFTTMALAILVDEGKLSWDEPVRNYFPALKLCDPTISRLVTLRDLLCHRTGIPGYDLVTLHSLMTRKELVERLQYFELNKGFRTTWQYNNAMYSLAGYLIEVVTGQTWEAFVQQRILSPLGMTNTYSSVRDMQQMADFALPYKLIQDELQRTDFYTREDAIGPAGSMSSNVLDMSKWLRCLLNKGKHSEGTLVSEEQFRELTSPQMVMSAFPHNLPKYPEEFYYSYALGWWTTCYRGHKLVQHSGGINGFSCLTTFLPDDNIGLVVLTNRQAHLVPVHGIFTYSAVDRLLQLEKVPWNERTRQSYDKLREQEAKSQQESLAARVPDAPLSHPLSAYAGQFEHPGGGTFTIVQDDDTLKGWHNDLEYTFQHLHYDVFLVFLEHYNLYLKGSFVTNLNGDIESFVLPLEPAAKPFVFTRLVVEAPAASL
ncbi:serine hydrolase [Ktedonobacter racemifer]|uniref:Beta-lactamase n=1 Tax=Ktedonobacter racemifer DSM 44963 TaxID=485913 RepID=D6TQE3_KTERA|nr:serine hydrolase [Ktedonobacter racemifer]EFH85791.1 beta-lactamase [Ktedonobacter racemifer DSM 44963]